MNIKTIIIGFVTGLINGIFGSGGGSLLVPCLSNVLDIEEHKAHATALSIILFFTLTSSFIYVKNGMYDLDITYKVAIGSFVGGIVGAKLLNRCTGRHLRRIFGIFMIIASIRLVF